ncbi:hypothetical protein DYBT9623_05168 [Dyadobacter sp. CECT 9623]|uniref:Uncharacterized protein n=1 Tax=Dyadobacter linearis TaxID=2823330 RepID=A0ABM8UXT5_9BACT|nr:hypothetical protein DYBT9623_05168 [Dyadobacter sp. CECT 9623]
MMIRQKYPLSSQLPDQIVIKLIITGKYFHLPYGATFANRKLYYNYTAIFTKNSRIIKKAG